MLGTRGKYIVSLALAGNKDNNGLQTKNKIQDYFCEDLDQVLMSDLEECRSIIVERDLNPKNFTETQPSTSNNFNPGGTPSKENTNIRENLPTLPLKESMDIHKTEQCNINITESENKNIDGESSEPKSEPFKDTGSEFVNSELHSESEQSHHGSSESEISPENDQEATKIVKRRKRSKGKNINVSNWDRNKNKLKRMKGENYTATKLNKDTKKYNRVEKKSRKMGPACNCNISKKSKKFYCQTFSEEERQSIFDNFWQNFDWKGKKIYITRLVDAAPVKIHRTNITSKQRNASYVFHLNKENMRKRVCKKMFLGTLAIGEWSFHSWMKKNLEVASEPANKTPRRMTNRKIKPVSKDKEFLIRLLSELPKMDSHYCRKDTAKFYLDSQ